MRSCFSLGIAALSLLTAIVETRGAAFATAFTYQGRLMEAGQPANGLYDLEFGLWTAPTNGTFLDRRFMGGVGVTNGLFTVELSFLPAFFDGDERWLEITVRTAEADVVLSPRQRVSPTPYALRANTSGLALTVPDAAITSSKIAAGAVTATQIASNSITAAQLAPGAAASNLGGVAGVPRGTIVFSEKEVNPELLGAGFAPVGTSLNISNDFWFGLPSGPPASGSFFSGRYQHKAVWTGTEMLIIGGTPDNQGLRYNPSGNSWGVMSKSNAPAIGEEVQVGWTGSQLLVWDPEHRVGGRYTPATDTWQAMSDVGAPAPRLRPGSAFGGGYLVIWGGHDPDSQFEPLNTGGRYNPANNTWTAMPTLGAPERRVEPTATPLGSEIVFFGGLVTNHVEQCINPPFCTQFSSYWELISTATGARYNPSANTWTSMADAPDGRAHHSAVASATDLYVWGGQGYPAEPLLRYRLANNAWTTLSTNGQPGGTKDAVIVWTGSSLLVWGGAFPYSIYLGESFGYGTGYVATNSGGRYLAASDSWDPLANTSASARVDHTAVWTGTQMIVFGGQDSSHTALTSGYRYTLSTDSWNTAANPPASGEPSERRQATGVWTGDSLIVWGGVSSNIALRSGGIFKPGQGWTATPLGGAPSARFNHTAVWTGNEMLIWGGLANFSSLPVNTGARFNPTSNRWFSISTSNAPRARTLHSAVWTGTEMIVWGGYDFTNALYPIFLGSGARYNPATDTWTTLSNSLLIGRAAHSAVWTGSNMIIWGGYSSSGGLFPTFSYFSSGARYDPLSNVWANLPPSGLTGRRSHTATWTGSDMVVWGGLTSAGPTNNGARYSPVSNAWTPLPTNNAPAARYFHTAVWNENRGQVMIWGGYNNNPLNSGGIYDIFADKWNSMATGSARYYHVAAWTGTSMIVFDGFTGNDDLESGSAYTPREIYYFYQKK